MGPDWVMLGAPTSDGKVMIFASSEMSEAELRCIVEDRSRFFGDEMWGSPRVSHYTLSATMRQFVRVTGATYEEALRRLLGQWKPERTERSALPPQPSLPPAKP